MNKQYTFYNPTTGIISFGVSCSEEVLASLLKTETDSYIEGSFASEFYYISEGLPVKISDKPKEGYFFNYETKVWELNTLVLSNFIIYKRNQLLQESDWTDTVSAQTRLGETLYGSWQTYRQELRDIPQQQGFPLNVTFPTIPQ